MISLHIHQWILTFLGIITSFDKIYDTLPGKKNIFQVTSGCSKECPSQNVSKDFAWL